MFDLDPQGRRPRGGVRAVVASLAVALFSEALLPAVPQDVAEPAAPERLAAADGDVRTVAQHGEKGTQTSPVLLKLAASTAPGTHELCDAGAGWLRVRVAEMALRGSDMVQLSGTAGPALVFQGSDWDGRTFFTRAFEGDCVRVRAHLAHPDSRVSFDALQSGQDLALATSVVAAVGDLCDSGERCSQTAAVVAALDPAKLILAGDNAYNDGTLAEYNSFYDPHYGPFKAITHPAAGNHEYNTSGARGYFDYFNGVGVFDGPAGPRDRGYYSVDIGDWHLVALNSNVPRGAGSAQEQWLRADLAATTKPCTLATFHHPRFSIGNYAPGNTSVQALYQALQDNKADLIVVGHDHNYQRWAPMTAAGVRDPVNGVRQMVVGTGGRAFYAIGSSPNVEVANSGTWGILKLTLNAADYAFEFLPVAGSTFRDSGSGTCKPKGTAAPTFGVSLAPSSSSVAQGGSTTVAVTVASQNGFAAPVALACSGLPAGVTCAFAPSSVTPPANGSATSTLTLSASATAAVGSTTVTVGGTSGTLSRSANLGLTVGGGGGAVTVIFTSAGGQDGRTWESTETSNAGGGAVANDATATALRLGDLAGDRQYRSVVSFDTSSLPDGATITAATLRLVRGNLTGGNPFASLGPCRVDVRTGFFGSASSLASGDFQAAATAAGVGVLSNPGANGAASTAALDAAGRSAVNKTGLTQLKLSCSVDDNDNNAYDYVGFFSGENATAANRPQLIVTYTP